jgi:DNA-binding response OmpR family regulator
MLTTAGDDRDYPSARQADLSSAMSAVENPGPVDCMNSESNRAHVLVVEDETSIRELWTEELSDQERFVVTAVGCPQAALSVLTSSKLAAAIIDLGLPEMSGEALIRIARSIHPRLPILVVTGFDARHYQHLWDKGTRVLQKPFRTSWLLLNLDKILVPYPEVSASSAVPRLEAAC